MKKALVSMMKKSGERAAMIPVGVRCWPFTSHQPKMPLAIREKMIKQDSK